MKGFIGARQTTLASEISSLARGFIAERQFPSSFVRPMAIPATLSPLQRRFRKHRDRCRSAVRHRRDSLYRARRRQRRLRCDGRASACCASRPRRRQRPDRDRQLRSPDHGRQLRAVRRGHRRGRAGRARCSAPLPESPEAVPSRTPAPKASCPRITVSISTSRSISTAPLIGRQTNRDRPQSRLFPPRIVPRPHLRLHEGRGAPLGGWPRARRLARKHRRHRRRPHHQSAKGCATPTSSCATRRSMPSATSRWPARPSSAPSARAAVAIASTCSC